MPAYIGYLRVSTKQQGDSGLGLEAQRAALDSYVRQVMGTLVTVYVEVESGKRADRPELAKAIAHAKRSKATLAVAKLDRLSRNVEFLARVMNSGCEFAAADMPSANRFMLHIMAAVAEHEAKAISERTKAALAAYRARGGKLGGELPQCRNLSQADRRKGAKLAGEAVAKAAAEAYADLTPAMREWRAAGLTLAAIAERLNTEGHTTRRGKPWNPVQVLRVLERSQETVTKN
jgi:DNA invertase Pin-like site-specific DNA recombinase